MNTCGAEPEHCTPLDQYKSVRLKGAQNSGCLGFVDAILCHGLFDISPFNSRCLRQTRVQYGLEKIVVCYRYQGSIFTMKGAETKDGLEHGTFKIRCLPEQLAELPLGTDL
jgi:hypothetical protein